MKRSIIILWFMVACWGAAFANAEKNGSSGVLSEIVVTASRSEEALASLSSSMMIIDREEIKTSAARTVGDLLAEKNIGHIQKYPGALVSVGIRGFRTDTHGNDLQSHVLVLLDGRRAGTGNLAKLLTENVERIEIIRGPGAVQYGSGGMGGVINIITRQGEENAWFLQGGGGNFGLARGAAGATAKIDGLDFSGTLEIEHNGDYSDGTGDDFKNTGNDYQAGVSINTGYEFMESSRLGVIFTYSRVNNAGIPGYISQNDLDDHSDKKNWSLDLRYTGKDSSGMFTWMTRGFLGEDDNDWTFPTGSNPDGWDDGSTSKDHTNQYGAQAQVTGRFGPAALTAGLDWIKYDIDDSWEPQESNYENPAVFMLSSTGLLDDSVTVNFGWRYDWYSVDVREPEGRSEDESRFTPMVGISWHVLSGLKLRFQYAQGFMMPSAWQLGGHSENWGLITRGNPGLDPEKSDTYEGGIDYMENGIRVSVTYFSTHFDDKIQSVYLSDGTSSWDNIGSATIDGLEAFLSYDMGIPLELMWEIRPYFSMTWLTKYKDNDTDRRLLYTSAVNLSSGIFLSDGDRFSGRLNIAYTSPQDAEDWESGTYPAPVIDMDGFTVMDLTAEYCMIKTRDYGELRMRWEIRNMLDEQYSYVKGYPMPGINFYAGLRWDY